MAGSERLAAQLAHLAQQAGARSASVYLPTPWNAAAPAVLVHAGDAPPLAELATPESAEAFAAEVLESDQPVLVDFWADWCGPCKSFAPVFEEASEQHPDISFTKVDTEAEQQLAGSLQIQSIPTIMAFRDGVLLFSQPGALPAQALDQLIEAMRNVDMDDVRKQIAEDEANNSSQ